MKVGELTQDQFGRLLLAVPPIHSDYCSGCAIIDECRSECDNEDVILIWNTPEAMAKYLARRISS